ncbi:MAG: TIGR03621 family F420-dependent LLM class oxidoreductase [Chloroflexi bacterium]|nr:TIGR03621 family F420-dependent LLM class oxidoreductase [Chloroflexota bacterium]
MRPFQFLIGVRGIVDRQTLIEGARTAESTGYGGLTIHDHLTQQMAPIPVLTAVAMSTERLRLVPFVLNNDLRHPAVLAQELATLDHLSGGRVVVGIGAGWNELEYRAAGIPFDPPGARIGRMEESIAILRGLLGSDPVTFRGRSYTIESMEGHPKPVQRPAPPFLIGGTRERLLRLAAREADIVGIDLRQDRESLPDAFPDRMDTRVGWIREAAGDRFGTLDLNVIRLLGGLTITNEPLKAAAEVARRCEAKTGLVIPPADIFESPFSLIGSVSDLVEKLKVTRTRWGINSYLVGWLGDDGLAEFAPVVEQLSGT